VVYIGSEDNFVYALNAKTGAKLWSYNLGSVDSSPAVVDGMVYVGADGDNDGKIYAFGLK
jgi:outer membrane protein assembly factor BamB